MAADEPNEPQIPSESTHNEVSGGNINNVVQIGHVAGDVHHHPPAVGGSAPEPADAWAKISWRHKAWDHTAETGSIRPAVAEIAQQLHEHWRRAESTLARDPWLDRTFAERMTDHVAVLLTRFDRPLELSPIEAAVLVLTPMAYQVWSAESVNALFHVGPTVLRPRAGADRPRLKYELFLAGPEQNRLVNRTDLADYEDRGGQGTRDAIGWWLFHQWVRSLLRAPVRHSLPAGEPKLGEVLTDVIKRITSLFRLSPDELRDEENRSHLDDKAAYPGMPSHLQQADEVRIGFLLVVAHELAIDALLLPTTLVEHLGIPRPLDLAQSLATIREAVWTRPDSAGISLVARCHHEAVLESLRAYAGRTATVLSAVRAVARKRENLAPLRRLPHTASADRIEPVSFDGDPLFLTPVAKFRLDDVRVRELLMGEQLYGDRSLAIRELYQNALDACRWQKARFAADDKPGWTGGRIDFVQREQDGRHILRCTDNGIGMAESDLREVFSRAGARFADRREFLEEASNWDPEVRFVPNSRFGIGVLSYFMLADEIEVTTRRRSHHGSRSPAFRVRIAGPGHLFRIEQVDDEDQPFGTSVTLYLRDGGTAPSCVEVLKRLLGIAEFDTYADHEGIQDVWHRSEFKVRPRPKDSTPGIEASGDIVPCAAGESGQVVWCAEGGGLLVDGIHVGLPDKDHTQLTQISGAIVNLIGPAAPRLTVDRALVREDVTRAVEGLMISAVPELLRARPRFLTFDWLCGLVESTPAVADSLTAHIVSAGLLLGAHGAELDMRVTGCFPYDRRQVDRLDASPMGHTPLRTFRDRVVLWRLLAHVGNRALNGLATETREVLPAIPSDELLIDQSRAYTEKVPRPGKMNVPPGHVVTMALVMNTDPADVLRRLAALGIDLGEPAEFPDLRSLERTDVTLLSENALKRKSWLDPNDPVPLGHVIATHRTTGMAVADIVRRLALYGFDTRNVSRALPSLTYQDQFLVSAQVDGTSPWIAHKDEVGPGHVIFAAFTLRLNVAAVADRLTELGFTVARFNRSLDWLGEITPAVAELLRRKLRYIPGTHLSRAEVLRTAAEWRIPPRQTARMLADMSFEVPPSTEIPDRLDELDVVLLDKLVAYMTSDRPVVSLYDLVEAADRAKCTPATAAARLAEHGFDVPPATVVTREFDRTDRQLAEVIRFSTNPRTVFMTLFEAAWRFEEPVPRLAERLRELGCDPTTVIDLFKPATAASSPGRSWVPVAFVIDAAYQADRNPVPMLDLVRSLGFSVLPDDLPPGWSDAATVKLVGRLNLHATLSVRHVLDTALRYELPIKDVVNRFTGLGLEVPDMAAELPPLLARVPFQD